MAMSQRPKQQNNVAILEQKLKAVIETFDDAFISNTFDKLWQVILKSHVSTVQSEAQRFLSSRRTPAINPKRILKLVADAFLLAHEQDLKNLDSFAAKVTLDTVHSLERRTKPEQFQVFARAAKSREKSRKTHKTLNADMKRDPVQEAWSSVVTFLFSQLKQEKLKAVVVEETLSEEKAHQMQTPMPMRRVKLRRSEDKAANTRKGENGNTIQVRPIAQPQQENAPPDASSKVVEEITPKTSSEQVRSIAQSQQGDISLGTSKSEVVISEPALEVVQLKATSGDTAIVLKPEANQQATTPKLLKAASPTRLWISSAASLFTGGAGAAFTIAALLSNPVGWMFTALMTGLVVSGLLLYGSAMFAINASRRAEVKRNVAGLSAQVEDRLLRGNNNWRNHSTRKIFGLCGQGLTRERRMQLMRARLSPAKTGSVDEVELVDALAPVASLDPQQDKYILNQVSGKLFFDKGVIPESANVQEWVAEEQRKANGMKNT